MKSDVSQEATVTHTLTHARAHAPGLYCPAALPLRESVRSHEELGDAATEIPESSEDPQQTCALWDSACGDYRTAFAATRTSMIGKPKQRATGRLRVTNTSDLNELDSQVSPPRLKSPDMTRTQSWPG